MPKVKIIRNGKPFEVDKQVYKFCKEKRDARLAKRERLRFITRIVNHFDKDSSKAKEFMASTVITQYKLNIKELLRRGRYVTVRNYLNRHGIGDSTLTPPNIRL